MTILDTNVLSALMHVAPDKNVVAWLDRQPRASIWITSITVLEVRFGLQILPGGKRRSALILSFQELLNKIDNRVVPFDIAAAEEAGDLMASRHKKGHPGDLRDTMIAGIAIAQHATLATRNMAHFEDIPVPLIDPWTHRS
jgi:predicted nucleic acid-binding protein